MKNIIFLILALGFINPLCVAETIILNSGQKIEGKIVEKTTNHVRLLDAGGLIFKYSFEEIYKIIDEESIPEEEEPQTITDTVKTTPEDEEELKQEEREMLGKTLKNYQKIISDYSDQDTYCPGCEKNAQIPTESKQKLLENVDSYQETIKEYIEMIPSPKQ